MYLSGQRIVHTNNDVQGVVLMACQDEEHAEHVQYPANDAEFVDEVRTILDNASSGQYSSPTMKQSLLQPTCSSEQ